MLTPKNPERILRHLPFGILRFLDSGECGTVKIAIAIT
jgi:hypothetical protein